MKLRSTLAAVALVAICGLLYAMGHALSAVVVLGFLTVLYAAEADLARSRVPTDSASH
jgi:hypothetical protein